MVRLPVLWPHGQRAQGLTGGKTTAGPPRSQCPPTACPQERFPRALLSNGRAPASPEPIVDMRLQGRGSRDPARGVQLRPTPGLQTLKKQRRYAHLSAPTAAHPVAA
jgi:hypothetical protein